MANSNSTLPTSSSSDSRSTAIAGLRSGGQANSRGMTDQSFASSTGTATIPTLTCRPWVSA